MLNVQSLDNMILLIPTPEHAPHRKPGIETTIDVRFFERAQRSMDDSTLCLFDEGRQGLWERIFQSSRAHAILDVSCFLFSNDPHHLCIRKSLRTIPL